MAHSKRNTSRAFFTSYERSLVKTAWSASSARLTRDSFLPFGACALCLEPAQDPVACGLGDLFCRECAVANMLAQRHDRRRHTLAGDRARRDSHRARARAEDDIRLQAVRHFEMAQSGVSPPPLPALPPDDDAIPTTSTAAAADAPPPRKRKKVLDEDERDRAASDERALAIQALEHSKAASKPVVSVWAPAPAPSKSALAEPSLPSLPAKEAATCPAASESQPHPIALRDLTPVAFTIAQGGTERVCPSCLKALSNATRAVLLKPCGHVLCRPCARQLMTSAAAAPACYVCDALLATRGTTPGKSLTLDDLPGVVELRCEGTGFSARGSNKIERVGLAFQC